MNFDQNRYNEKVFQNIFLILNEKFYPETFLQIR